MKIFYLDLETTGVDHLVNGMIQLAYIVEIEGVVKKEGNIFIQPYHTDIIELEALLINNRTKEELFKEPFIEPHDAFIQIIDILRHYIDRYDKKDKFYLAGYNVGFDANFLSRFFVRNGYMYWGSYFHFPKLDPMSFILFLVKAGLMDMSKLPNFKLATLCDFFDIKIDAHDALSDIRATKALIYKCLEIIKKR